MSTVSHKEACPECRKMGNDDSGDNLVIYEDKSGYCFACGYYLPNDKSKSKGFQTTESQGKPKKVLTEGQKQQIKDTTFINAEYRGIRKETAKYFGVRYDLDEEDEVLAQYYPCTIDGELSGYKKRNHPKGFLTAGGETGKECDLFGQFRFRTSKGFCLIVGGEIDQLSAYQMLRDDQLERNSDKYDPTCVVSPTIGETGSAKQIAKQYKFFDQFERIIIGFDNDDAGRKATEEIIKVLPKGKIFTVDWRYKDPNSYMWDTETNTPVNKQASFIKDFWKMKKYVPAGIVGSNKLMDRLMEHAKLPKIPLPPFLERLQKEMAGGIPLGYIINIGAASGVGKTSFINELIYFWIYHSPHEIGVVSTELEAGQYSEVILSRHLGKKLALFESPEEKIEYLSSEEVQKKATDLFQKENGKERWLLVDDRDGGFESIKTTVEEMVVSCGCKVIIIDVLSDLLSGMSNEQQSEVMAWQKRMIKSHQITFINISHTRKKGGSEQQGSEGAFITEEDLIGSSDIYKSAGANILIMRNKYAEDPIERNTTKILMSKCRWSGNTGWGGELYYDNQTHTLYDKEKWLDERRGSEF